MFETKSMRAATLALVAALPGCGQGAANGNGEPYRVMGPDAYEIKNEGRTGLLLNLAEFRMREKGDFILVAPVPSAPLSNNLYAIRKSVSTRDGGVNTIDLSTVNFGGK